MANRNARHRILAELVHEGACDDVGKEIVDLCHQPGICALPLGSPERCEDLDCAQQRTSAIGELGGHRRCKSGGRVQRDDSNWVSDHAFIVPHLSHAFHGRSARAVPGTITCLQWTLPTGGPSSLSLTTAGPFAPSSKRAWRGSTARFDSPPTARPRSR